MGEFDSYLAFSHVVGVKAMLADEGITLCRLQVRRNHLLNKLVEAGAGGPTELALGLGRIAKKSFHLCGTEVTRIDSDDEVTVTVIGLFVEAASLPCEVQVEPRGAAFNELPDAVLLTGGDDVVLRLVLLQHEPLHLDVVASVTPVALGVQISHVEGLLQADLDARQAASDLAGDEGFTAQWRLVVEEDAIAGEDAICLAVVHAYPEGIELGDGVRRTRIEGRRLALRGLSDESVEFGGRSLVELRLLLQAQDANRFEKTERAHGVGVGRVLGLLKRDLHVRLRAEVVDLVGLHLLDDVNERRGVGEIAVVQKEAWVRVVRILVDMVDAVGIEQRRSSLDAVDFIAFGEEKLGEVGSILAGNSCDQGFLQT
jgi:hypothetical protein